MWYLIILLGVFKADVESSASSHRTVFIILCNGVNCEGTIGICIDSKGH